MNNDLLRDIANSYIASAQGSDAARLRFIMGVWDAQAQVEPKGTTYSPPSTDDARSSLVSGQPLFSRSTPQIDAEEYAQAVARMAAYVAESAVLSAEQSSALGELDFSAVMSTDSLRNAAAAPEAWVARASDSLVTLSGGSISSATAAFVLHSALVPFLVGPAAEAVAALGSVDPQAWGAGSCPVCGSAAAMGRVGESTKLQGAQRTLWCGSCHTEWGYDRIRCVRCGCRAADKLRYTYVDGDPAHRLHLCDECHGYARFVFEDDMRVAVAMPVEDAVTTPLDALATQQGYTATGDGGAGAC